METLKPNMSSHISKVKPGHAQKSRDWLPSFQLLRNWRMLVPTCDGLASRLPGCIAPFRIESTVEKQRGCSSLRGASAVFKLARAIFDAQNLCIGATMGGHKSKQAALFFNVVSDGYHLVAFAFNKYL